MKTPIISNRFSLIDLYSGYGGVSMGFARERFQLWAMMDPDKLSLETAELNLKCYSTAQIEGLPSETPVDALKEAVKGAGGLWKSYPIEVDHTLGAIVASPPSNAPETESRGVIQYIRELLPHVFIINVPKPWSLSVFPYEITNLEREYNTDIVTIDISKYQIPQNKKMRFAVGIRRCLKDDRELKRAFFGKAKVPKPSAWSLIQDLPRLANGESYDSWREVNHRKYPKEDIIPAKRLRWWLKEYQVKYTGRVFEKHSCPLYGERDIENFKRILPGESGSDAWWRGEAIDCNPRDRSRYYKLDRAPGTPSKAVTANFIKERRRFIHPTQNRALSMAEAARIHTFPDGFVFPSSDKHMSKNMGNSIPPYLAYQIAAKVKYILREPCTEMRSA